MPHYLVPQPKTVVDGEGKLKGKLYLTDKRFSHLKLFPTRGKIKINFAYDGELFNEYQIEITAKGVSIVGKKDVSIQYALTTLYQLVKQYGNELPCMRIEDAPQNQHRAIQICTGQVCVDYKKEWFQKLIFNMALLKATHLYLYFEMDYPFLCLPHYRRKGQMTQADIKELIALADTYHITVVPCINVLGHCGDFLSYQIHNDFKEYDENTQNPRYSFSSSLCTHSEKVREMVKNMIEEICDLFPSDIIHVGGDEVDLIGKCPNCAPDREEYGKNGVYLQYFRYINSLLKERGKKMGIWADEVLIMEPECRFWNFRKHECSPDKFEQDMEIVNELRDNTIFYDWFYNGASRLTQEFFHKHGLQFISCSSTFTCYMTSPSLGQGYAEHALYSTAEELGAMGMLTTDWINQIGLHAELGWFPLASGLALNWCGCGEKFCKNHTLDEFLQAYSFQAYGIEDESLIEYLRYAGDFESELLSAFPPQLRGLAIRKMVFSTTNPLTFSMLYSPYLKGDAFNDYKNRVAKLEELFSKIDLKKQDEYFFINKIALICHQALVKRYEKIDLALTEYDKAAKAQPNDKKAFKKGLTVAAKLIRSHKKDLGEAMQFAKRCSLVFGLENSPVLRLEKTLKNIDKLADFILSMKDGHRLLPTFNRIAKFLFSTPENSYWENGSYDWMREHPSYLAFDEDNNPAPAAPIGFASETKYVNYP